MKKHFIIDDLSAREFYSVIIAASFAPAVTSLIFSHSFLIAIFAFIIALSHTVSLGVPFFLIVTRYRRFLWWDAFLGGFGVGALPLGVITIVTTAHSEPQDFLLPFFAGLFGLSGGVAAWLTLYVMRKQIKT